MCNHVRKNGRILLPQTTVDHISTCGEYLQLNGTQDVIQLVKECLPYGHKIERARVGLPADTTQGKNTRTHVALALSITLENCIILSCITHREVVPVHAATRGQRVEIFVQGAGRRAPREKLVDAPNGRPVVRNALRMDRWRTARTVMTRSISIAAYILHIAAATSKQLTGAP